MKKIFLIFIIAFVLNLIWENLHSYLYAGYMGGEITEFILIRASLFDALIISVMSAPFVFLEKLKKYAWLIIFMGLLVSIFIELYALRTGRWAYNEYMPIIPLLDIGFTPTIQLGLTGYFAFWFSARKKQML